MPPIIHCIRHGQGFHNVGAGDYTLRDPQLTTLGKEQSMARRKESFADQTNISLVTASPLCRTLHSACIIFEPALSSGGTCQPCIIALPDAQETSDDLCDVGSDPACLERIAAEHGWPVDLSLVTDGWNDKALDGRYSPRSTSIAARAHDTRLFLRKKVRQLVDTGTQNPEIVLVTHGGFLHYFTDDWEDAGLFPGTGWRNCEMRSYVFEQDFMNDDHADARLIETAASRAARGKPGVVFGRQDQPRLFELAMQQWGAQGLQRPDQL